MSDHDVYEREVANGERFFVAINEVRPPFIIQLMLEGEGDPDPDELHEALERTTSANPGSSLHLKPGDDTKWTIGPAPTLTVVDAPEFAGDSEADGPFLRWPLDCTKGPTCELVLVRGKHHPYLLFRAVHAVMDGQGTLLWVKDFMRCLRGEEPVGHPSTLTVDQFIRDRKEARKPVPPPEAIHPFGKAAPGTQGDFFWRRVTAPRPLHSAASGRIAVALAERARKVGEGVVRINLPTDLRHYCPNEKNTGNFFNTLYVDVPVGASPEAIGLKIVQMLYKNEGAKPYGIYSNDTAGSLNMHRVRTFWDLAHLHDTGQYAFSATLSHLGVLKGAELSAPGAFKATGAYFVPLVGDSGCVVSLNGFDDHTEACVGLSDRFAMDGHIEELAALIKGAISG